MKIRLLSLLLLALSVSAFAETNCGNRLSEAGISGQLATMIDNDQWKKEMFEVRVLRGVVEGIPRTLVLLGEVHVNSERGIQMVRALREHFHSYALEGVDRKKMWAHRVVWPALYGLYNAVGRLLGRRSGSTIADTMGQHALDAPETAAVLVKTLRERIDQLRARGHDEDFEVTVPIGNRTLTLSLENLENMVGGLAAELSAGTLSKHVYTVEKNHRPSLVEQAGFATTGALIYGGLLAAGWLALERVQALCTTHYDGLGSACSAGGGSLLTGVAILGVGIVTLRSMALVMTRTLIGARNDTMAANMVAAFAGDNANNRMLAIVGQGHNEGLIELFTQKYGFEEIALETNLKKRKSP